MLLTLEEKLLRQQISLKEKVELKKQVLVLATSALVIVAKEEAVKNIKDGENPGSTTGASKDGKNPNLARVLCI